MQRGEHHPKVYQAAEALREALDDKPPVKTYAGGKRNYCTPVDAVNISQERVDETDKFNHITVVCHKDHDKGYEDYAGKCLLCEVERLQKRDNSSWVGLTEEEISEYAWMGPDVVLAIEEVQEILKEKNT